jgi:hypothetical protein
MWVPICPWITLTVPGSPIRATYGRFDGLAEGANFKCHALLIQQCPGNTGLIYIFDKATGATDGSVGTCGIIPAPSYNIAGTAIILPHAAVSIPSALDAINAAGYWVYGTHNGDKVAVSCILW